MKMPSIPRQLIGVAMILSAISITLYAGYSAHKETVKLSSESKKLSIRQEIMFAVQESEHYPLVVEDEHRNILIWNQAMQELTGYTHEEIKKVGIPAIIGDPKIALHHTEAVVKALKAKDRKGKVVIVHGDLKTKAGKLIPVRVAVYVFQSKGDGKFALARINPESEVIDLVEKGKP